jgi:hypothetical protein
MIFRIKDFTNKFHDYIVVDSGKFADKECLFCVSSVKTNSYEEFVENVDRQNYQINEIRNPEYQYRKMLCSDFAVECSDGKFIVVKSRATNTGMLIEPVEE